MSLPTDAHPQDFRKYATGHLGISATTLDDYIQLTSQRVPPPVYNLTPNVIEERQANLISLDVFSRLMMERIIFLGYPVDDVVANIINAQLLYLQSVDAKKDISIYINSPGGSVYAGLGMYDVMQHVSPDISTVCTGIAASMAAVLLAAGSAGKRMGLPHSRVMIHQPLGGAQGQASDIEIVARQIQAIKQEIYDILSQHTGKPQDDIWRDADRDYWMRAEEARDYGLIDEVVQSTRNSNQT